MGKYARAGYTLFKQRGPMRQFENSMRCKSQNCGSPTFIKVQGVPLCLMHALRTLNELLIEAGITE